MRYGMILFIASEVMFFVGWFWSWFDFALFPEPIELVDGATLTRFGAVSAAAIAQWPPSGLEVLNPFDLAACSTR